MHFTVFFVTTVQRVEGINRSSKAKTSKNSSSDPQQLLASHSSSYDCARLQANSCKWTPIHSHFLHISLYRFTFTQNQVALFSYSTLRASPCTRCKLCTSHLFSCLVPHLTPALPCGKKWRPITARGVGVYEAESRAVISRPALQLLVRHRGEGGRGNAEE